MRLVDVMEELAVRLRSIKVFRTVFAYPPGSVTPPAAIVSYPDSYNPHSTYARGATEMELSVWVVLAKVSERTTPAELSALIEGPTSVITVLESGSYESFDVVTVSNVEFETVTIGATDYIAAGFSCDIVGSGA